MKVLRSVPLPSYSPLVTHTTELSSLARELLTYLIPQFKKKCYSLPNMGPFLLYVPQVSAAYCPICDVQAKV